MTLSGVLVSLAPEWILLAGACAVLIVGLVGAPPGRWAAPLSLLCTLAALWASLKIELPAGEVIPGLWLTSLTYYARLLVLGMGVLILLVNWHQPVASERGEYHAMILFSLLGVLLTASSNDWLVLFFAVELVSIPTYVLVALSRDDARASEAAIKYFFLGALAAAILALGLVFLYGEAGTTAIHRISPLGAESTLPRGVALGAQGTLGLMLVFAGLAFKVAAFPFHVYAADVYEGAASPVSGLLGFNPKFAGFLALIKVLAAIGWNLPSELAWLIWFLAAATMTVGNVVALLQRNVKRMLAYSSVAHTGYMLIALLVGPAAGMGPLHDGVAALLFYIAVYGAMNLGAFAVLSAFLVRGKEAETLEDIAGAARNSPAAALALAVCVFSLMGLPPTAGFVGKLYIFSSAFSLPSPHPMQQALVVLAVIGVINSAIAAAYYLRIVATVYMGRPEQEAADTAAFPQWSGMALCSAALLLMFAFPGLLSRSANKATMVLQQSVRPDSARLTATSPQD